MPMQMQPCHTLCCQSGFFNSETVILIPLRVETLRGFSFNVMLKKKKGEPFKAAPQVHWLPGFGGNVNNYHNNMALFHLNERLGEPGSVLSPAEPSPQQVVGQQTGRQLFKGVGPSRFKHGLPFLVEYLFASSCY